MSSFIMVKPLKNLEMPGFKPRASGYFTIKLNPEQGMAVFSTTQLIDM